MKKISKIFAIVLSVFMLTSLMAGITFAGETVDVTVTYDTTNYHVYYNDQIVSDGEILEVPMNEELTFSVELTDNEFEGKYTGFYYFLNSEKINNSLIDLSGGSQTFSVTFDKDSVLSVAGSFLKLTSGVVDTTVCKDYETSWELEYLDNYKNIIPIGSDYKFYIKVKEGYIDSAKNANNKNAAGEYLNTILCVDYKNIVNRNIEGRGNADLLMWDKDESDPDNGIYCFELQNVTSVLKIWVAQSFVDQNVAVLLEGKTINVNFYMDEDETELYKMTEAKYGSKVSKPVSPTKEGYGFRCWCTKDKEEYDFDSIVQTTSDMNLYARWSKEYTVTFYDQGEEYDTDTVLDGDVVEAPEAPSEGPEGKSFLGWYKNESDTETYDFDTPVTENLNLYSKWGVINVTGVTLNKESASLKENEALTLLATVEPKNASVKTVTWKSSNENIAIVDENGKVTTKNVGSAIITATTTDGEFTADCEVIVSHDITEIPATEATCTKTGNVKYYKCMECGKCFSDEEGKNEIEKNSWVIPAKEHSLTKTPANAPTYTEEGNSEYWTCTVCGKYFADEEGKDEIEKDSWIIPKLDKLTQTITAKAAKSKIVVGNTDKITVSGAKTTVTYKSSKTSLATVSAKGVITAKAPGTVTITVTAAATDQYKAATKTIKITVNPKATKISSAKNTASKKVTVKWKKVAGVTGYQIKYVTGKTTKTVTIKGAAKVKKVLTKLKKGKTYKIYVRTYKTVSKTNYYSSWSAVKKVKITK